MLDMDFGIPVMADLAGITKNDRAKTRGKCMEADDELYGAL